MDGRTQASHGDSLELSEGRYGGADEVSRLWVGLEYQQEVLGPIAVELMALLYPDATDEDSPEVGTDTTLRE